uniref:MULE transposase domain-containing protein n=1 Tax=Fagus sylvatica TaxID=28930 RepID=A0A2N9GWA3_FAGSY
MMRGRGRGEAHLVAMRERSGLPGSAVASGWHRWLRRYLTVAFTLSTRLDMEYVDLIYCHRPDVQTPIEETVRAMNYVIDKGWAFYWGTSEWFAQQITEAWGVTQRLDLMGPIVEQPEYNLLSRHKIANEMINGRFEDNYHRIRDYSEELKVSNPGVFYGCRPMISLDTCHLRGFVKGQILVAVGIDANDGMYLIAFAVCEGENNDSWKWFLRLLLIDIKHPPAGAGVWNFISDQQKGLKEALKEVIPEAPTRFCLRHLYANFKNKFKGKTLKDLMWAAAKETTKVGFNAKMEQIKVHNKDAYGHLKGHTYDFMGFRLPVDDMVSSQTSEVRSSGPPAQAPTQP